MDVLKFKKSDLKKSKQEGTFLYEKCGNYYFSSEFVNLFFNKCEGKIDKKINVERKSYDLFEISNFCGGKNSQKHFDEFIEYTKCLSNKPSVVVFSQPTIFKMPELSLLKKIGYKYIDEREIMRNHDYDLLDQSPCFTFMGRGVAYNFVRELLETRKLKVSEREVFLFFNQLEDFDNMKDLDQFIALSKDRKVHFILNTNDEELFKKKYGEILFNRLKDGCQIHFITD